MAQEMRALTVRLTAAQHEDLLAVSTAENRPVAEIVRETLTRYLEQRPVEEIKALLAEARSLGPATEEEMSKAVELAAEHDTSEGIGNLHVVRGGGDKVPRKGG